ncbi:MAG: hypothetical protein WDW36_006980 [Sanguina aurantia]
MNQRTLCSTRLVERPPVGIRAIRQCRARSVVARASAAESQVAPGVFEGYWTFKRAGKEHQIRYQRSGESGEALLLVHGFGGNCDHWRKNTPALGANYRAFSIDLLGYGYSDKPDPRGQPQNSLYCFETWGEQLASFTQEMIQSPAFLICNSVGGLAGLQASITHPELVRGVQLLDISLRGLHASRINPLARPFLSAFQKLLRETDLGTAFFGTVATTRTVTNILKQAYGDKSAVTEELVDKILTPGLRPGAAAVFLDFISYSGGPLPEELLAATTRPVSILWGAADPWEDVVKGRALFASYPMVTEFVELPGVGHCPMDEAPVQVNALISKFVSSQVLLQGAGTVAAAVS